MSINLNWSLADVAAALGNTVGTVVSWRCRKCGQTSKICDYSGNIVAGNAKCPKCGQK